MEKIKVRKKVVKNLKLIGKSFEKIFDSFCSEK
jgi:hypothetical protein